MPHSFISKDKDSDFFENNAETGLLSLAKGPCLASSYLALAEKYSSKLDISLAKGPCLAASYLALAENKHSYNSLKQVLLVV